MLQVVNPAVGDGLSNLLLVAAILARSRRSPQQWRALYTPLPSRLSKLQVRDRHALRATCMDTRVEAPRGLQEEVDAAAAEAAAGRAFVRPSGTENVVRVYAEAATQREADALALRVLRAVHRLAGGVGQAPRAV